MLAVNIYAAARAGGKLSWWRVTWDGCHGYCTQKLDDTYEPVHELTVPPVTQLLQPRAHHGHGKALV